MTELGLHLGESHSAVSKEKIVWTVSLVPALYRSWMPSIYIILIRPWWYCHR